MLEMYLQRFAEDEPVVVDVNVDDDDEPVVVVPEPEPHPITTPPMPSGVPAEAWRNVEEMLVTLSNNVRLANADMRSAISTLTDTQKEALHSMMESRHTLNSTMIEFKTLLETAIVDAPAGPEHKEDNPPPASAAKRGGYLSRRNRG